MYKIQFLSIIGFILAGCASSPQRPIDAQCDKVGLYARSVVTLRDVGVSLSDINNHARAVDSEYRDMNTDAYNLKTKNPSDAYIAFYQMCVSIGYSLMVETYKKEELIREKANKTLHVEEIKPKHKYLKHH